MFWDLEPAVSRHRRSNRSRRSRRCAAVHTPRTAPVVLRLSRANGIPARRLLLAPLGETDGQRAQPRAASPRFSARRRRKCAVRPLHARRHERAERRAAPRHGAVRSDRMHQLPPRTDVPDFTPRTRRCRITRSCPIRWRRQQDLTHSGRRRCGTERDSPLHTQRHFRPFQTSSVFTADQPWWRTRRPWADAT